MIGSGYVYNQIGLRYFGSDAAHAGWTASAPFVDFGFASDNVDAREVSTEGELTTRYIVDDASDGTSGAVIAAQTIMADLARMNIERLTNARTALFVSNGEDAEMGREGTPVSEISDEDVEALRAFAHANNFDLYGLRNR